MMSAFGIEHSEGISKLGPESARHRTIHTQYYNPKTAETRWSKPDTVAVKPRKPSPILRRKRIDTVSYRDAKKPAGFKQQSYLTREAKFTWGDKAKGLRERAERGDKNVQGLKIKYLG